MSTLAPVLTIIEGRPMTTSKDVAEYFGKQHKNVLRAINDLLSQLPDDRRRNFAPTSMEVPGPNGAVRQSPMYRMTRSGFTLLAMNFTGAKALLFKLTYMDEFDRMEAALNSRPMPAPVPRAKPAYMFEDWFTTLALAATLMRRCVLARAIGVSAPTMSQILNGSGKYGAGIASTANMASRVRYAFGTCRKSARSASQTKRLLTIQTTTGAPA